MSAASLGWLLVLTAGCDRVFQLELRDGGPDAAIDAASDTSLPTTWNAPQGELALPSGVGDDPSLTADLLELYWNTATGDIARTTRASLAAAWSASADVPLVSSPSDETTPEVSPDGLTLYFGSQRPGGLGVYDVMMSTRTDRAAAWTVPVFVPGVSSTSSEASPTVTADGLDMVMSSTRPGGASAGVTDVWIATRASTGDPWGTPTNVTSVNTAFSDSSPFITADGLSLYIASNATGNFDLYVATRTSRGQPFGARVAIPELNLPTDQDEDPWVSPDGHHLFYMRNTGSSNSQLLHATR